MLLLHYEINGITSLHIKELRKAHENREKMLNKKLSDIDKLWNDPFMLKLRCRKCSKVYTYEVERVFYDLNALEDKKKKLSDDGYIIGGKITCKNCQAVDQYEFTSEAMMYLNMENMRILMLAKKAKDEGREYQLEDFGRIQPIHFVADGGKKMNPRQAISLYQERIEREPNNPLCRLRYGNVLRFMNREDEAMVQYQKAVELDNTYIEAYVNLGVGYEERGELVKAKQIYQKILNLADFTTLDERNKEFVGKTMARLDELGGLRPKMIQSQPVISLPVSSPKIGRNQPCPCGSGKKYKHCCLDKGE